MNSVQTSVPSGGARASGSPRTHLAIVAFSALLTAQLVPSPPFNVAGTNGAPIDAVVAVPGEVDAVLLRACYDCHSSRTEVPWYGAVQPVKGWIAGHVEEGRRELNFDAFGLYRVRRQYVKLDQIASEVRSEAMPLPSYLWMHAEARLSDADRTLLVGWVNAARGELEHRYPPDSLQRRR
jgi:hypothetical protein